MTTPLSEEYLAQVEARAKAATEGPWFTYAVVWNCVSRCYQAPIYSLKPKSELHSSRRIGTIHLAEYWEQAIEPDSEGYNTWPLPYEQNVDFILEARADIPNLLSEIRRLKAKCGE